MAFDAFAKIGDIKGESLDDKHKDWIEVLSFSAGITRRSQGGRPNIEDFKIVKKMDAASPLIFDAACEGDSVGHATFVARKAGKGQQEFLVIKMSDVIITSVQHTDATGAPRSRALSAESHAPFLKGGADVREVQGLLGHLPGPTRENGYAKGR